MPTQELSMPSQKKLEQKQATRLYDTVIVGAGAAGVGMAIALMHAGVENYLIIERNSVGSSFAAWPSETRFITPSFPSNSIGMLDLNSVAIGVSPAYNMRIEHPTGQDFADHLRFLADEFELPIWDQTNVNGLQNVEDEFVIETSRGTVRSKNVIWAAGEYQYPLEATFEGSEFCRHTATVESYAGLDGDDYVIIGGYESGIDAAYHLAANGSSVRVFDGACPWGAETSDPSVALSTYTFERMESQAFSDRVELFPNTKIKDVDYDGDLYTITTNSITKTQPLLAVEGTTLFHLFEKRDDGFPLLNEHDGSTIFDGMYLCGPSVRHDGHIFCFIFKYRQRFGIVARSIAESLGLPTDEFVAAYRSWGMFLDDLSCCGQECLTC